MAKEQQKQINEICMNEIDNLNNYIDSLAPSQLDSVKVKRLRHCSAHVITYDRYYVLISYRTAVAFIDRETGNAYDVLRYVYGYTATSAQHISKFLHDYSWNGRHSDSLYLYR